MNATIDGENRGRREATKCRIFAFNCSFICNTQLALLIDTFLVLCAQYTVLFSAISNHLEKSKIIFYYNGLIFAVISLDNHFARDFPPLTLEKIVFSKK